MNDFEAGLLDEMTVGLLDEINDSALCLMYFIEAKKLLKLADYIKTRKSAVELIRMFARKEMKDDQH